MNDIRCPCCKKILFQSEKVVEFGAKDSDSVILCKACKARIFFKITEKPAAGLNKGSSLGS